MVEMRAPDPQTSGNEIKPSPTTVYPSMTGHPSVVGVTLAGCGGCGINLARVMAEGRSEAKVLFFDTSMTNSRKGEKVNVLASGDGSGSNRAENSRDLERAISALPENEFGASDVAILTFSLAGGSGSVIGPLLAREYARREGMRVICVAVADTTSTVAAKNTINTLKTLTAIANNASLYMPIVVLSNDRRGRRLVDDASAVILQDLIELLTKPVFEVDRNDRLNWIDPAKVISAKPGLKLMSLISEKMIADPDVIIGQASQEMVDSTLLLQVADEDEMSKRNQTRLRKVGFYDEPHRAIMGTVSGDITAINAIIDSVENVQNNDKSQRYEAVDRLSTSGGDDLIL